MPLEAATTAADTTAAERPPEARVPEWPAPPVPGVVAEETPGAAAEPGPAPEEAGSFAFESGAYPYADRCPTHFDPDQACSHPGSSGSDQQRSSTGRDQKFAQERRF